MFKSGVPFELEFKKAPNDSCLDTKLLGFVMTITSSVFIILYFGVELCKVAFDVWYYYLLSFFGN